MDNGETTAIRRVGIDLALTILAVAHRGCLYWRHWSDGVELAIARSGWELEQYVFSDALRADLWGSFVWLRQAPPVPSLFKALFLAIDPGRQWAAFTAASIAASLVTAIVLSRLVARRTSRAWLGGLAGALFILNPDLVVLESGGLGQYLYEFLAMALVALVVLLTLRSMERPSVGAAVGLGVATALLALTRASYSYFAVVPAAILLLQGRMTWRRWAAFLTPIVLLHGGWAVKNLVVYGDVQIATSTWTGGNLVAGMVKAGHGDALRASVLEHAQDYPPWFVHMVESEGLMNLYFNSDDYSRFLPPTLRRADEITQQAVQGHNAVGNRPSKRVLFGLYRQAFVRFALENPGIFFDRLRQSYVLYWLPIRYHTSQHLGLFTVDWVITERPGPLRIVWWWGRGSIPEEHFVTRVTSDGSLASQPARLFSLDHVAVLLWALSLAAIHLVIPFLVARCLWLWIRSRELALRDGFLLLLVSVYAYSALVHNVAEYGENMRFRLSVEPVIWLLTLDVIARFADLGRSARWRSARRRSA